MQQKDPQEEPLKKSPDHLRAGNTPDSEIPMTDRTDRSKISTTAREKKTKLPPIPPPKPGERAYYSELYHKAAKASLSSGEFDEVTKQYHWSCRLVYKLKSYKTHWFYQNEMLQGLHQVPLVQLQRPETWDERQEKYKNFADAVLPYCEEALKAGHRFFRNRSPIPAAMVRVDTSNSFIVNDVGAFIHVWKTNAEAKKFLHAYHNVAEKLQELHISTIFVPYTALFSLYATPVTATALAPLLSDKPVSPLDGPILTHQISMLETYCRTRSPLQVYLGGDARYYVLDPTGVLHTAWVANGERSCFARMVIFDFYPQIMSTADALEETVANSENDAIRELIARFTEIGETTGVGVENLKIQDLVLDRVVPDVLHARGVKIGTSLYYLTQNKKCGPSERAGTVVKETIIAEIVCRTMKEILRAEIAAISLMPNPDLPITHAFSFVIELMNRCIYNLLVRPDLWDTHFLDVVRTKFRTPDSFVIPQSAVTKRLVLAYLTTRLGTIFDAGKFTRCVAINVMHTGPAPDSVTKLVIAGKKAEAHELLLSRHKRIADIKSLPLQICSMVHQSVLFAVARSPSLDWYLGLLSTKINEMQDETVSASLEPALIECYGELPDLTNFRNASSAYLMSHIEKIGSTSSQDTPIAIDKYRVISELLDTIEKGHQKELVGSLRVKGTQQLLSLQGEVHKALTSDVNCALLVEAANYLYTVPDSSELCLASDDILKTSATIGERCTPIAAGLQRFAGGSLDVPYEPSKAVIDSFRDVAYDNLALHYRHHGEKDQRFHIAILLAACHWGFSWKDQLTEEEREALEVFTDASIKIHNTLPSEQREMLKGEWYLKKTGPAAEVLMNRGQWAIAQHMVRFGQAQTGIENPFLHLIARKAQLPDLQPSTTKLAVAIDAAIKIQQEWRRRKRLREEREQREREEAERRAALEKARELYTLTPLSLQLLIIPVAKATAEIQARRTDPNCIARLQSIYSRKFHPHHGLRAMLGVANEKCCSNLCFVMLHSGTFPPFKWDVIPGGQGRRMIIIVPDTECIGAWWHKMWLVMADFNGDSALLFAKGKAERGGKYKENRGRNRE